MKLESSSLFFLTESNIGFHSENEVGERSLYIDFRTSQAGRGGQEREIPINMETEFICSSFSNYRLFVNFYISKQENLTFTIHKKLVMQGKS